MRRWLGFASLLALSTVGCAGAKVDAAKAPKPEQSSGDESREPPVEPSAPVDTTQAPEADEDAAALTLPVEPPLAAEVNAGVISRAALDEVLSLGVGRFLRSVRTEPLIVKGRFSGWRILGLFMDRPEVQVAVLRPGDTVRKANGQSLEHPESFKAVWDSLGKARELVLDIDRDGHASKLRYTIAD